jgi:Ni,Fe-hydrogenase maturation factor
VHDANFATALELGRRIGLPLPPDCEIRILAVEILENSCFGDAFSEELERAYPAIREEVLEEVRALL